MTTPTSTLARVALTLLAAGGVISTLVWAGPLNPPGGAVSSTYKTLTEVEPRIAINATNTPGDADSLFKITQPGSYYLTGNITGAVGKIGIEIAASGVTLDLMGFELAGVTGSGDGIRTTVSSLRNINIRNGSVRGFAGAGVNLNTFAIEGGHLEGLSVSSCGGAGIAASDSTVVNCVASANEGTGIFVVSSTVTACTATANLVFGMSASSSSAVTHCTATDNALAGISASSSCLLANCVANSNDGPGIAASSSSVTNCTANNNLGSGISASSGSAVSDCTAVFNSLDAITLASDCIAVHNTCDSSGTSSATVGAGIRVTGSDNRIEANNCTDSDFGIQCTSLGNIIIRNTCSGNTTNWDVVAGNTILVVQASSSGAVLGNAGGAAPGSTDPNANFTY
ncbi:MAG: right-handed parallel beta-helix repeat-containing protein [Phycisphaerales bacterium]|nr:right-handed parallel beta-helix repeat-containing protein [Phycisphaerales bacterium]